MATFFYFLGQLFGGQLFELFARETNLKKQSSVNGSALDMFEISMYIQTVRKSTVNISGIMKP